MSAAKIGEVWLTLQKVCALTGWSEGHVRRIARSWSTRASESRGRNGKSESEYLLSSLSIKAQAQFAEESRTKLAIIPTAKTLPLFASAPVHEQAAPRVAIPEDLGDQARAPLKAVEPLPVIRQSQTAQRPAIRLPSGKHVTTMHVLTSYL